METVNPVSLRTFSWKWIDLLQWGDGEGGHEEDMRGGRDEGRWMRLRCEGERWYGGRECCVMVGDMKECWDENMENVIVDGRMC